MEERYLVSVMILNQNGKNVLKECLQSLLPHIPEAVEVLVVDNGSTDGSQMMVEQEFPRARLVAHEVNLGFSRGYNAAVPFARGRFLIFLNNDMTVERGWLEPLIHPLLAEPDVGATGPLVVLQGLGLIEHAGAYVKFWTGASPYGFGQNPAEWTGRSCFEPFYVSGGAMAVRKELFQRLGGFDENMWAYYEDLDLCWRIRLAGYRIKCCPKSIVYHRYSHFWGILSPAKLAMATENHLRCYLKNLSWYHLLHCGPAYAMFAATRAWMLSFILRDFSYVKETFRALVSVILDWQRVWHARQVVQSSRVLSDGVILNAFNRLPFDWPATFLRRLRLFADLGRARAGHA
jgi:GT2 family glycosyltransferase